MSGADDDRGFLRRVPKVGWLAGLIVLLLVAFIGWHQRDAPSKDVQAGVPIVGPSAPPASTPRVQAGGQFGAMSIVRSGNGFALNGELPDDALKATLLQTLRQAMPGAKIVDQFTIKPGVKAPEFAGLGAVFGSALDIPKFSATLVGDTVTLAGMAPTAAAKEGAATAATSTWPKVNVVNDIQVVPAGSSTAAPAPAPAGACVTGLLKTPITFDTDGFTPAPASRQLITQLAATIKACPNARVAVTGYTDSTGSDSINGPLSVERAKSVAAELVSAGIGGVTSQGAGAANPVASNSTATGRAQNRRAEITVG